MKKTINITLNGLVFNIEEDAYDRLFKYLELLKVHFGTAEYGSEVVQDIESRIAEQFSSKVKDKKKESVNLQEVDEIIKHMGEVSDLTGDPKSFMPLGAPEPGEAQKHLFRNPDDQVIAGVSGGIASYFGIDPLVPRLLFVLGAFLGGYGLLIYIILWIIVPMARSSSEKLQMKGNAVTVANLEESHKGSTDKKSFSMVRYFFKELFYLIHRFFRMLGPLILTIIGLFTTAISFVVLFAITLITLIMLFNPDSTYIDPVIAKVFNGSQYVMLISSAYVSLIIPTIIALLLGVGFVRRRRVLTAPLFIVFATVWLVGALTFGFMGSAAAPQIQAAVKSIEDQPSLSQEFEVSNFSSILANDDQKVKIIRGAEQRVVVYGREEQLKDMQVKAENGRLRIEQIEDDFQICFICINRPVTIEVTVPELALVQALDSAQITVRGFNNIQDIKLEVEGASRIDFDGDAQNISIDVRHASRVDLRGTAKTMDAEITGASHLSAAEFIAEKINLEAEHSSRAEINATLELNIEASGASRISYDGNPGIENISATDASRINKIR